MKKGFGIFFIILGSINTIISFIGISVNPGQAITQLIFAIGILLLGLWMVNSSKKKENS